MDEHWELKVRRKPMKVERNDSSADHQRVDYWKKRNSAKVEFRKRTGDGNAQKCEKETVNRLEGELSGSVVFRIRIKPGSDDWNLTENRAEFVLEHTGKNNMGWWARRDRRKAENFVVVVVVVVVVVGSSQHAAGRCIPFSVLDCCPQVSALVTVTGCLPSTDILEWEPFFKYRFHCFQNPTFESSLFVKNDIQVKSVR